MIKKIVFLNFLVLSTQIHAFQYAIVQKYKALVYADQKLTTPIGYIKKGHKVKVGEVFRQYGTILPIAISGKIAYIKVEDLELLDKKNKILLTSAPTSLKRSVKIIKPKLDDKLSDNNYVILSLRPFTYQGDWTTVSDNQHNSLNQQGIGTFISVIHRSPYSHWRFGFSFGLQHLTQETLEIATSFGEINAEYSLITTPIFSIDLTGSFTHSFQNYIKEATQDLHYTSPVYGYSMGAQIVFFPFAKFSLGANYSWRALNFYHLIPEGPYHANTVFDALNTISSSEIQMNIMYRF